MSQIIDAVRRIGNIAKERNWENLPGTLFLTGEPYISLGRVKSEQLTQKQLEIVNEYRSNSQLYLTREEIEKQTREYSFKLPEEFYELYQLGNGCLPFDVFDNSNSSNSQSNSVYDYFDFPSYENPLWTLGESMDYYCSSLFRDNPRLLAICSFEDESGLFIIGNDETQKTSPIVSAYGANINIDISKMDEIWPSLTNMMLAYAELFEGRGRGNREGIYKKYGSNCEYGLYYFN